MSFHNLANNNYDAVFGNYTEYFPAFGMNLAILIITIAKS